MTRAATAPATHPRTFAELLERHRDLSGPERMEEFNALPRRVQEALWSALAEECDKRNEAERTAR